MQSATDDVTEIAQRYYNSDDADNFYFRIWGGEDIHIGLYDDPKSSIFDASRKTVEAMAKRVEIGPSTKILDAGAGYGGAARYLANRFGCSVVCLNLSEAQNERNRQLTREQGLESLIRVVDGAFEDIPEADGSFDLVWSQDAFLHSGDKMAVLKELHRVLRGKGRLVFTDPMQSDDCPAGVLQPILDRIHLTSLGSPGFYRAAGRECGFDTARYDDLTEHLVNHYRRVLEVTETSAARLAGHVSAEYQERMKAGLRHWIDGGQAGYLAWGIFLFQKL